MQTDEAIVIRRAAGSPHPVCSHCVGVPMITPEEAALLFRVAVRAIYREIEAGQLHFQETPAGFVVVCLDSLHKIAPSFDRNSSSQSKTQKEIQS